MRPTVARAFTILPAISHYSVLDMLQGLRTVVYPVSDLGRAKEWYSAALEQAPYFDEPFYVGFNVGGYELGLVPDGTPAGAGRAG